MNLRRNGLHAAPTHESLPVAWRRLAMNARVIFSRRPGARTADAVPDEGSAPPVAGSEEGAASADTPIPAGAVPLIDTVLLAGRGEHPYPVTVHRPLAVETPVLYQTGELPRMCRETEDWWDQ